MKWTQTVLPRLLFLWDSWDRMDWALQGSHFMLFYKWAGLGLSLHMNLHFFHLLWPDGDYRAGWNLSVDVGEKKGCAVTRLPHRMTGNMCAKQAGGRKGQEPSCLCYRSASLYHLVSLKQPCWETGMNFSPVMGHKCLSSHWNIGSPTHTYALPYIGIHTELHKEAKKYFSFVRKRIAEVWQGRKKGRPSVGVVPGPSLGPAIGRYVGR